MLDFFTHLYPTCCSILYSRSIKEQVMPVEKLDDIAFRGGLLNGLLPTYQRPLIALIKKPSKPWTTSK